MYKAHVFICTNSPERPGKCGNLSSDELKKKIKDECKLKFGRDVRVSSSGCMGQCEHGIASVIYPQNKWLLDLKPDETSKIISEIESCLNGAKNE